MKTKLIALQEPIKIRVKEDTQFVLDFSSQYKSESVINKSVKSLVHLIFEKPGVSAEIIGLFKLKKGQEADLTTIAEHKAPHTSCHTAIKGVLEDKANSNYVGKILIDKKAQQTTSFLRDDVLIVGQETENSSQPILEIEADDVKASHGATTGRVDNQQLYYLMSRGLTEKEAEDTVVEGFFEPLLAKIRDEKIRAVVKSNLS